VRSVGKALQNVEVELEEATNRARVLIETTEGRLFTVRPNQGSWSAAECLGHLTLSSKAFMPVLTDAVAEARNRGLQSAAPPKMDVLGRLLRWFMEPPIRSRFKTSAPFVPQSTRAKAQAFAEFTSLQTQLLSLVRSAQGLDLARVRIVSPFDKRIRYNVWSAFYILTAHERRHLWQAEQAVQALRSVAVATK
jgi:hypothetical protein